ncbi:HK97 gp10 family phage protein [Klebsiella pneumoniae]|nr:HK97 gp10 family phage protein [Klebsiella pneumoniae]
MADGVEVNLTGLDSVLGKLDAVSQVTRDKSGRAALRKAANVIRDRARNNAARVDDPLTKEAIYKNIVVSFSSKAFRRTGDPTFRVGVMGAPGNTPIQRPTSEKAGRVKVITLPEIKVIPAGIPGTGDSWSSAQNMLQRGQ